jgi:hypothetical protein
MVWQIVVQKTLTKMVIMAAGAICKYLLVDGFWVGVVEGRTDLDDI